MNKYKVLIWHYSEKNDEWYDDTENIAWYKEDDNAWVVKYFGSNQFIHISFSKMEIFENPIDVNFAEIYYKDSPCYKVKKVLLFNHKLYKIIFENDYIKVAPLSEVKIVKNELDINPTARGIMSYYRRVVQETAVTEEDHFLLQEFDSIDCVSSDSVLSLYLRGDLERKNSGLKHPIVAPFGINLSQSKAIAVAFSNRISVIEGPPGTGKTQTILNFIANAIINNKTVAVVSNNNSATDNIYEKLKKYGYSFFAAHLGNSGNVEEFFESYNIKVPSFKTSSIETNSLKQTYQSLPQWFEIENNKKKANEQLDAIKLECKHFLFDNQEIDFNHIKFNPKRVKSSDVLNEIIRFKESDKRFSFWDKLKLRRKLKVNKTFFEIDADSYVVHLNYYYYLCKINEVENELCQLDKRMGNQTLKENIDSFTLKSKQYFEGQLPSLFVNRTKSDYEKGNYKRQFNEFIRDYPVILSSTYSLARCCKKGFLFDYLIIDESSQVNMASAILSMRVAKNIIIVGDIKQLPQIDDSAFKERNEKLLDHYKVPQAYSYYGNSILSSILTLYKDKVPRVMLKEHYRCNPNIISFCNQRFYNNELIIYTSPKEQNYSMKVIKTSAGNHARKSPEGSGQYNLREIDEIKKLLEDEKLEDVGVIAPYRCHTQVIEKQLGNKVDASTVHKFQGREKKTIIFSSVVNNKNEFVDDENIINVAVSRAIDKFIMVTSDKIANSSSGVLSDLVNYITYNTEFGVSEEGTIKSIYDLLYEDYQEQLEKFRLSHPSKDFDSENITKELLVKILSEPKFSSLGLRMHVSLKDFILLKGIHLSDDEYKFFRNPNTHVDFLIYNKMSRMPILAIEVDGVSFHEQKKKQRERDEKKNSILEKVQIKLLRLKTNESNEQEKIRLALVDAIS